MEGRKANLRKLHPTGHDPNVEDKAAMKLARAIHCSESTGSAVSWSAQERAQDYFNTNGLGATLVEAQRFEGMRIEDANA